MSTHNILKKAVLTEKSTRGIETLNVYTFEVSADANKILIKKAIEDSFGVKVAKVNIRNKKGKFKRLGRSAGYGQDRKEALVTLRPGDKLDVY